MLKGWKQVDPQAWPTGFPRTVGLLGWSPEEVTHRLGILFANDIDNLGNLEMATIEIAAVGQVMLTRHVDSPVRGTEVEVDAAVGTRLAITAILDALLLERNHFDWIAEETDGPATLN